MFCSLDKNLQIQYDIHLEYMSVHVLLNLLNEFGKRDKMQGLLSILSFFRNKFNKFNNTRAQISYDIKITLTFHFVKTS